MNRSPLRYPGGKSRITNFVAKLIKDNNITGGCYVEPFAGGAGVALNLLLDGISQLRHHWLVSYDDQKEIREIYQRESISYLLRYTVGPKYHGSEVMFASDNLILDFSSNPLNVKKVA